MESEKILLLQCYLYFLQKKYMLTFHQLNFYSIAHILLSASLFIFLIFHLLLLPESLLSAILNNITAVPIANIICTPFNPKKDKAMICDNCFIKYYPRPKGSCLNCLYS